jgi:excisionase family DNA binding protein
MRRCTLLCMTETERWMTRAEAAELLRIAPRTLDSYVRNGSLPRYVLGSGRTPRYRIEDVRKLVRSA